MLGIGVVSTKYHSEKRSSSLSSSKRGGRKNPLILSLYVLLRVFALIFYVEMLRNYLSCLPLLASPFTDRFHLSHHFIPSTTLWETQGRHCNCHVRRLQTRPMQATWLVQVFWVASGQTKVWTKLSTFLCFTTQCICCRGTPWSPLTRRFPMLGRAPQCKFPQQNTLREQTTRRAFQGA